MDDSQFYPALQPALVPCHAADLQVERSGTGESAKMALGTDTRNSSASLKSSTCKASFFHPVTGEAVYFEPVVNTQTRRSDRWAYKSVVNKILPRSRTQACMNLRACMKEDGQVGQSNIEIKKTKQGKAHLSGLMACGSLWNCPICAAKISEKRRQELKLGLELAKNHEFGLKAHLVTLTVPHGQGDDLKELRLKIRKAQGKLSNGRKAISQQLAGSFYGFIRALEVTHGKKNGFHPHLHMIVFTDNTILSRFLEKLYSELWIESCKSVGLPEPSIKHGCTVKDGSFADDYISKWGLEDEMTKANTKISNSAKGVTPFGMLKAILDYSINDEKDEYYTAERCTVLFRIYSKAFKGARQLHWSPGLKKLLGLNEVDKTDEELAREQVEEDTYSLGSLSFEQWQIVRKRQLESSLLNNAENMDIKEFNQFIYNVTGSSLIGLNGYGSHTDFLLENAKTIEKTDLSFFV